MVGCTFYNRKAFIRQDAYQGPTHRSGGFHKDCVSIDDTEVAED